MTDTDQNKEFLRWEVKPFWSIRFPSILVTDTADNASPVKIFGVDRGSLDIVRNWEKIQSVEQFNQGFVAKPEDLTFTIAVKERGKSYEVLRRLAIGGIMFDINCDLLRETVGAYGDRPEETGIIPNYQPWLDGFEVYQGCIVQREGQTVEIATFPIREFECEFLRHVILGNPGGAFNENTDLTEGDGTYPHLADLSLSGEVVGGGGGR